MFWIIISEWRGVERPGCCSKLSLQSSMMRMDWCFLRSWVIQSEQSWPWLSTTADILLVEMDKMLHKFYQLAVTTATTNIRYLLLYFVSPWQLGVAGVLGCMRERSSLNCVNGPKQVLFSFIWPNLVLSEITCKVRPVHTGLPSNLANRTLIWRAECGKMVTEIRKKIMANCSLSRHYRKIKISFLLSFIFIYKYKIYYH